MKRNFLLILFAILFLVVAITAGCTAKKPEQTTPEEQEHRDESTRKTARNPRMIPPKKRKPESPLKKTMP